MKRIFIIACLSLIGVASINAQAPGLLGKKFSYAIGSSISSYFLKPDLYLYDHGIHFLDLNKSLPTSVEIITEYNLSLKTSMINTFNLSLMSDIQFHKNTNIDNHPQYVEIVDSFRLRPNLFSIDMGMRFYKEYAPFGRYYSVSINGNFIRTTVYPSVYYTEYLHNEMIKHYIDYPGIANSNTFCLGFTAGIGKQIYLSEKYKVDYGFQISMVGGNRSFNYGAFDDHRENLHDIVDFIMIEKLYTDKLVELYLNIGICP